MRRGTRLMESDRASSWREARSLFRKVMENDRASEDLQQEAEELFYESKRRTLVMQAENGAILRFQDQESQKFGNAIAAVIGGEREKADQLFRELVESLDPEGEQKAHLCRSQAEATETVGDGASSHRRVCIDEATGRCRGGRVNV